MIVWDARKQVQNYFIQRTGMPKNERNSFESTLSNLESTLKRLEDDQLSLTDCLGAFEEGLKLVREAQTELQTSEQRIVTLTDRSGDPSSGAFQDKKDDL